MNIVILEPLGIPNSVLEDLSRPLQTKGHRLTAYNTRPVDEAEQISRAQEADVLIIANQPLGRTVLEKCPHLKLISVAFTGVDHLDTAYARSRGICVCNAAGYATQATAEQALLLALSVFRHAVLADNAARNAQDKTGLLGQELYGKTFGIVGTGAIGSHAARLAAAFGCRVIAYSRTPRKELLQAGVEYMPLARLLAQADVVSLHVPLTAQTKHLLGAKELALMKPTAVLINTARGPLVDAQALAHALRTGQLAGAGIDVFDQEPPLAADNPLLNAPHTILSPHIGFFTQEALAHRARIVFENIHKWEAKTPQNQIV